LGSLSPETVTDPGWSERLSDLEARMPTAPVYTADGALVLGFRALQQSVAATRAALSGPQGAEAQLDTAREHLESGRSHLTDLLG
jgi:hypothetical protein